MHRSIRIAVAAVTTLVVAHASHAATVSGTSAAAFQREAVTSGSIASGGSFATRVIYDGSGNESRAVYEFGLPTLPAGGTFSSINLNYVVAETTSGPGVASQLRFTTYQGNGVYNAADADQIGGPTVSPLLFNTGSYTQALPTTAAGPWLGVNAWQEQFGHATGIARGGLGGAAPTLTYAATVPDSGTLTTRPLVDGLLNGSGGSFTVTDGLPNANVQEFGSINRRAALEFALGGVPQGATVTSAKLLFDVYTYTSDSIPGGPRFYGYVGDGQLLPADGLQTSTLLATGPTVENLDAYEVTLSAASINALLAAGADDTLGILVRGSVDGEQFGFVTNEGDNVPAGTDFAPRLVLTYAVPEPTTLAALAGVAAVVMRRRRR